VSNFEVIRKIGSGGFGNVFLVTVNSSNSSSHGAAWCRFY
jgi:serine/threonine protein kinase